MKFSIDRIDNKNYYVVKLPILQLIFCSRLSSLCDKFFFRIEKRTNIGILFLYEFKLGRNIRSAFEEDSILEMGGSLWWNFKNSGNENLENETRGNIKQG